ncbi:DUF1071 domain-containing protein [Akkermansia muciniphila]|uniref:Sak single strand annealing protein n=1 Tax=Akkermansia muciniphila TaxID=239935 RepID=UPI00122ECE7D|nr:DUF1071 domain-containing protein [Akkermansia muciniphila]
MLKPFRELLKLDLSGKISQKPIFKKSNGQYVQVGSLDYLSWVDCLELLYEHGAESVTYGNVVNEHGHSLFLNDGKCPEVRVHVDIDGMHFELTYPVIDGSRVVDLEKLDQSDVHNATQRGFVKCVAINTGLGLQLWEKEEREQETSKPQMDENDHSLKVCMNRIKRKYGDAVALFGGEQDVLNGLGIKKKTIENSFAAVNNLLLIEDKLGKMFP